METDGDLPSAEARDGACSAVVVSPGITGNALDPDLTCAVTRTRACPPAPSTTELFTAAEDKSLLREQSAIEGLTGDLTTYLVT